MSRFGPRRAKALRRAGVVPVAVLLGLTLSSTNASAGIGAPASLSVSASSARVGTRVVIFGNVGGTCAASVTSVDPQLRAGPRNHAAPFVSLNAPVGPGGTWSAAFVIPPYLGGGATFQGGAVSPGTYYVEVTDPCAPGGYLSTPVTVTGTENAQPPGRFVGMAPTTTDGGYWLAQAGGGVYSYGTAAFYGSLPGLGVQPAAAVTGMAAAPTGHGYWMVGADGGVYAFGSAGFYGSLPGLGLTLNAPVVGITPTPDGHGYWLLGADGGVYAFGDATFAGSSPYTGGRTALSATPGGTGYFLFGQSDMRAVDVHGGARPALGDFGPVSTLLTGGTATPTAGGYWLVGAEGGVFSFGNATFHGSLPGLGVVPAAPVVGIARTKTGGGYWMVGADGGVYAFGNAGFFGSAG